MAIESKSQQEREPASPSQRYGTPEWFDREYQKVADDPWGLTWRSSQLYRYQKTVDLLKELPYKVTSVVDIGCATGDFTYVLSRRLPGLNRLLGLDFVDQALQRARERFPTIEFSKGAIDSVGEVFPDQFDLATCLEVLYYLDESKRSVALESIRKTLRRPGYVLFSSYVAPPPHFSPQDFLQLVGSRFNVVSSRVLHLKAISFVEKIIGRFNGLVLRVWKLRDPSRRVFGRMPLPFVSLVEKASRGLGRLAASHTIVLARVDS